MTLNDSWELVGLRSTQVHSVHFTREDAEAWRPRMEAMHKEGIAVMRVPAHGSSSAGGYHRDSTVVKAAPVHTLQPVGWLDADKGDLA